jgi:hypothetical protein
MRLPVYDKNIKLDKKSIGTFYRINDEESYLISLGESRCLYEIVSEYSNLGLVYKPKTITVIVH